MCFSGYVIIAEARKGALLSERRKSLTDVNVFLFLTLAAR